MMDISDGLSSELLHICTQSKAGCRVYEEHIPIDYQTAVMAEEFNMNLTTCALNGGEDYELLFTVPIADHEKVSRNGRHQADRPYHETGVGLCPNHPRRSGI